MNEGKPLQMGSQRKSAKNGPAPHVCFFQQIWSYIDSECVEIEVGHGVWQYKININVNNCICMKSNTIADVINGGGYW